jgi:signal transduction histidine kinase
MAERMIITERLASLGTLATGVAHEINNPLAVIRESAGWMALLLKKAEFAGMPRRADFEHALGKIEKSVERARKITHQLLGGVRKNDILFSETDLGELALESAELLRQEAMGRQVVIVHEVDPSAKTVWSDPHQLRQILINLMTNAIHASRPGGEIRVTIRSSGDHAEMAVQDEGEGIPRENLTKIFDPFFSTKSPGQGTGLGLFVTRCIAEKLGGRVEVESEVGQGATFRVTFPRQPSESDKPPTNKGACHG